MNTEKIMEDIQSVQDNIREIKSTWDNTIMTLDNIKSGLKADVQKKVDEAYQRGLEDGKKAFDLLDAERDADYQRGLDEAMSAFKKLYSCGWERDWKAIGFEFNEGEWSSSFEYIIGHYTAAEIVEKVKAYDDKQKDRIEVGDIVRSNEFRDIVVCVTYVDEEWKNFSGFAITDAKVCRKGHTLASCKMDRWHKTGEHFDIEPLWRGES